MNISVLVSAAVLAGSVHANEVEQEREWTTIGEEATVTYYADLTSLNRQTKTATMWMLSDFDKAREDRTSGRDFVSQMGFFEFDCHQAKSRILYYSRHTEHKAGGDVIFERDLPDNDWRPVPEDTQRAAERQLACS